MIPSKVNRTYNFKFFKGGLPQILLGSLLKYFVSFPLNFSRIEIPDEERKLT